jgi:hypothetical protein
LLIALCGYGTEEDQWRAGQAGFDFHFVKLIGRNMVEWLIEGERDPEKSVLR